MDMLSQLSNDSTLVFDQLPVQLKASIFWKLDNIGTICRQLSKEYYSGSTALLIETIETTELTKKELIQCIIDLPQVAVSPLYISSTQIHITSMQLKHTKPNLGELNIQWSFEVELHDNVIKYTISTLDGLPSETIEDRNGDRHKFHNISSNAIYHVYLQRLLSNSIPHAHNIACRMTLDKLDSLMLSDEDPYLFAQLYCDCHTRGLYIDPYIKKIMGNVVGDSEYTNIIIDNNEHNIDILNDICNKLYKLIRKDIIDKSELYIMMEE